jgi:hypothetical protein
MTNNKQQTPHGFCETPEQKCTMNYCDENGCQNRKRILAEPTDMTNNKQQTAVQWFLDQLIEHRIIIVDKTTYQVKYKHEILLEQAKEMEVAGKEMSYADGYEEGYKGALEFITQWAISNLTPPHNEQ